MPPHPLRSPRLVPSLLTLLCLSTAALLAGCPTITLGKVGVKPGSASGNRFTLDAEVVVEETEETTGEGKNPSTGRGMVGLFLPEGWRVVGTRVTMPGDGTARGLVPAPQIALTYGEAFPDVPGVWWAFGTATQEIHKGRWVYPIEIDVEVPKKAKEGVVGFSAAPFKDDGKDLPAPAQLRVDPKKGTAELLAPIPKPPPTQ